MLKESSLTAVPGTRTSATQYEFSQKREFPEEYKPLSQAVRQGNREYPVSPIYRRIR